MLRRQCVELLSWRQSSPVVAHLRFADHVHDFDATENDARAAEVLEALYRACDALDRAMVLLDNVVEVFALSEPDPVWWTSGYNKTLVLSVRPSFFVLFRSSRIAVDTVEQEVP